MNSSSMGVALRSVLAVSFAAGALSAFTQQAKPEVIYPDSAVAPKEIKDALDKAKAEHKRVILDFGGNWCGDCRALAAYFKKSPNDELLSKYFVLVDVNIGKMDANLDIAKKYEVPLSKGVPALAVLDAKGTVLFSQKKGEFESMRSMDVSSVTKFLDLWKGTE